MIGLFLVDIYPAVGTLMGNFLTEPFTECILNYVQSVFQYNLLLNKTLALKIDYIEFGIYSDSEFSSSTESILPTSLTSPHAQCASILSSSRPTTPVDRALPNGPPKPVTPKCLVISSGLAFLTSG